MSTDPQRPVLIVVVGPTGSGKTDLSIQLAQHYGAEIISTDSRQVFRGMAVGTAQPSAEQLAAVKHYFIADRDVEAPYSSGIFEKEAMELLPELFERNPRVVAVGGSGLYVDALCNGLDDLPLGHEALRRELQQQLDEQGLESLVERLRLLDKEYYNSVDRANPARVMRGLEVCLLSGRPYSEQRGGQGVERFFDIVKVGVAIERSELYDRINLRVDMMMNDGLECEARALYAKRHLNSLQTVGYREMFDFFDRKITLDQAVELIKRNSRRYAKRQMTWFGRDKSIGWFAKKDMDAIEKFIENFGG